MKDLARATFLAVSFLLPVGGYCLSAGSGNLQVRVLDSDGQAIQEARLYLYNENLKVFSQANVENGFVTLVLAPGHYRLYSARSENIHGYLDHAASPETRVEVSPYENTSVILSLNHVATDDVGENISVSTRRKIGLE